MRNGDLKRLRFWILAAILYFSAAAIYLAQFAKVMYLPKLAPFTFYAVSLESYVTVVLIIHGNYHWDQSVNLSRETGFTILQSPFRKRKYQIQLDL